MYLSTLGIERVKRREFAKRTTRRTNKLSTTVLALPVIFVVAFFVVQWEVGVALKQLVVAIGSFLITLGLIELLIRPFKPVRTLFGMKSRRRKGMNVKASDRAVTE